MIPPQFDRHGDQVPAAMIPCLSIRQPWAWLIVKGIKPVENRTWRTSYRGRVLIHAGLTYPKREHGDDYALWWEQGYPAEREKMVGGIVGEAVIVDCVREHSSPYFNGPYGFVLERAKAYPSLIPYGGRLGFFGVPEHVVKSHADQA